MPATSPLMAALHAWMRVFLQGSMGSFMRYARGSGVSMQHLGLLHYLHHRGAGRAVSDIGQDLGVSSAAASQMIERLVQQGLLARSEDPNDRRMRQIALTDKGRALAEESVRARQTWMQALTRALTPAQQKEIVAALNTLTDAARSLKPDESVEHVPAERER